MKDKKDIFSFSLHWTYWFEWKSREKCTVCSVFKSGQECLRSSVLFLTKWELCADRAWSSSSTGQTVASGGELCWCCWFRVWLSMKSKVRDNVGSIEMSLEDKVISFSPLTVIPVAELMRVCRSAPVLVLPAWTRHEWSVRWTGLFKLFSLSSGIDEFNFSSTSSSKLDTSVCSGLSVIAGSTSLAT